MGRIFVVILLVFSFLRASSDVEDSIADSFDNEFKIQKKEDFDPLKGYNVIMTNVNDKFYTYILFPIAKGYKKVIPTSIRSSASNFFDNLLFPVRFVNNLLQFKIRNSFEEIQRFVINSTIGFAGLFDIASDKFHIKEHDEDFGQTLGYYGVGGGLYIVLPILGPSNIRDTIGLVGDMFLDPKAYMPNRSYNLTNNDTDSFGVNGANIINKTSFDYKKYEAIKKGNIILYPILKSLYKKRREQQIKE